MYPITLQRKDKTISTVEPPCYGFLRDCEWTDWEQSWYHDSWQVSYAVDVNANTHEDPFDGDIAYGCSEDLCTEDVPSDVFDYESLYAIWNSGAEIPYYGYAGKQLIAQQWLGKDVDYTLETKRPPNVLEQWCEANGHTITMKEVMNAFEAALDKGRESCLLWDESSGFMGVRCDVPCDRALFYLMVNRELSNYVERNDQIAMFLDEWLINDRPIIIAFMISRMIATYSAGFYRGQNGWVGGNHDSIILPAQNFWVGCGKRFAEPVAIDWMQHSYNSGKGHMRDDDYDSFFMSPDIEGYHCEEAFNYSMFHRIFGGHVQDDLLLDKENGRKVLNLVCELVRAVVAPSVYQEKAGGGYLLYWQCDRMLHSRTEADYQIPFAEWPNVVYKLLMDE